MPQGIVRSVFLSRASGQLLALVDPVGSGMQFSIVDLEGPAAGRVRQLPVNSNSIIAFNDKYLIWNQPTPLDSMLHVYSLDKGTERIVRADIRGIVQMTLVDDTLIAAAKQTGSILLVKLNLQTGKVDRLDEFTDDSPVLALNLSSASSVVLVDPVNGRYKLYQLKGSPAPNS